MLARVDVVNQGVLLTPQDEGPSTAQHVVEKRLTGIGIKTPRGTVGRNDVGELVGKPVNFLAFPLHVGWLGKTPLLAVDLFDVAGMADDAIQCRRLFWRQDPTRAEETARRPASGDLPSLAQICQGLHDEAVRFTQGCVLTKDDHRIDKGCQQSSRVIEPQVKVPGLELAHLGRVARAGLEPVEGHAFLQVEHRHPRFDRATNLLETAIVHTVGHDAG